MNDYKTGKKRTRSFKTWQYEQATWERMLADRAHLGLSIEDTQGLPALVAYWQGQQQQPKTIANKLALLRRRATDQPLASNAELGVFLPQASKTWLPASPWKQDHPPPCANPLMQTIIDLQRLFGLTLKESLRVMVNPVTANQSLIIARNVAWNHQDRSIPIVSHVQRQAIQARMQLLGAHGRLTALDSLTHLSALARAELRALSLNAMDCRQYYAQKRYQQLEQAQVTQQEAFRCIEQELGIQRRQLRRYL